MTKVGRRWRWQRQRYETVLGTENEGTSSPAVPYEVRLRVAARCDDRKSAHLIGDHVRQLNMQGPYGAGGPVNTGAKEIIAVDSVLIPKNWVEPQIVEIQAE